MFADSRRPYLVAQLVEVQSARNLITLCRKDTERGIGGVFITLVQMFEQSPLSLFVRRMGTESIQALRQQLSGMNVNELRGHSARFSAQRFRGYVH